MKKNNSLKRMDLSALVKLICQMLLRSSYASEIREGVILRLVVVNECKAEAQWFRQNGPAVEHPHDVLAARVNVLDERFYIVGHTKSKWTYWFCRYKLGQGMYLRPFKSRDRVSRDLMLIKLRTIFMELT